MSKRKSQHKNKDEPLGKYYTYYFPHSKDVSERVPFNDFIRVVSIDPGRKNFALRIEDRYPDGSSKMIAFHRVDVKCHKNYELYDIQGCYTRLTEFLDSLSEHWPLVRIVIVERQPKKSTINIRVGQHTISYFIMRLRNLPLLPEIYELDTHFKGNMLEKPKAMDTKDWSVALATRFFEFMNDEPSLKILAGERKKDDLCDTKVQIEALFRYWASLRS